MIEGKDSDEVRQTAAKQNKDVFRRLWYGHTSLNQRLRAADVRSYKDTWGSVLSLNGPYLLPGEGTTADDNAADAVTCQGCGNDVACLVHDRSQPAADIKQG